MSEHAQELLRICEALPAEKQAEVIDFAQFLLAREDDEAWERTLADTRPRPKLETFLRECASEPDAPFDASKL